MGQMISNASNYMIVCVHRSATDRPTIAYYPLVMGFMNGCKDMKLSTGLRCFIKAENNSRMNGRWFTSYRGYSADPCMHAHTHKHRYMHSHWCSSVKIHLRRQRDIHQASHKQAVHAGKWPSKVFSEKSLLSAWPSFKFTFSTGQLGVHTHTLAWRQSHTNCFLCVFRLTTAVYNGFYLMGAAWSDIFSKGSRLMRWFKANTTGEKCGVIPNSKGRKH